MKCESEDKWRNQHHGDLDMFGRFMDIMMITRPTLCVVDALIAGEGDGPVANQPHWIGCILASTDPVATDVAICRLLGHDWRKLNFAREAEERGIGAGFWSVVARTGGDEVATI